MKRKILAITLSVFMTATMLAGCTGGNTESGPVNRKDNENTESVVENEETTDDEETAPKEEEKEEEAAEEEVPADENDADTDIAEVKEDSFLLVDPLSDFVFLVDEKGTKIKEYDLKRIYEDYFKDNYTAITAVEYYNGFLIVKATGYEDENWFTDICAVDDTGDASKKIYRAQSGEYIKGVDVYNGDLYISLYDYNGKNSAIRTMEKAFENTDKLDFAEFIADAQEALSKNDGNGFEPNNDNVAGYGFVECYTKQLNEYGHLITVKDNSVYEVLPDGEAKKLSIEIKNYINIVAYDKDYLFVRYMDDENIQHTYLYTFADDSYVEIEDGTPLDYSDGKYYYCIDKSTEYGILNNHIYSYDAASGNTSLIYETRNVPGVSYSPGTRGFSIIGGEIYFVDVMDRSLKWVRVNYDESGASYTDIYCSEGEISTLKYGDIEYYSRSEVCPYCGTKLDDYYEEAFRLSPEYSDYYQEINDQLKIIGHETENTTEYSEDACKEHLENPQMYHSYEEIRVSGVRLIKDRYLSVDMDYYWYSGGAHGMPGVDYKLFDLTTGKCLTLADFFEGSQDDFKDIVKGIVERDYNNKEEYIEYMYSADDLELTLKNVSESTYLEMCTRFTDDGVYLVYSPYTLGPYASGFIEIYITYEELLGRDTL